MSTSKPPSSLESNLTPIFSAPKKQASILFVNQDPTGKLIDDAI